MKNSRKNLLTVIIAVAALSPVSTVAYANNAKSNISNKILPNSQILSDITSKNGKTRLQIPKTASKIMKNTGNQVEYKVNDAVTIDGSDGITATAPVTVDSQINSTDNGIIEGTTSLTADLSEATIVPTSDNDTNSIIGNLLGMTAYADSNTSYVSTYDKTYGVKIHMTIYWSQKHKTNTLTLATINSVSGGYTRPDSSIKVTGSLLQVAASLPGVFTSNLKNYNKGTSASWTQQLSLPYVEQQASSGEVNYIVHLLRSSSKWDVSIYKNLWGTVSGGGMH